MKYLIWVFGLSLLVGQLGRIELGGGIAVYLHDVVLLIVIMVVSISGSSLRHAASNAASLIARNDIFLKPNSLVIFISILALSLIWQLGRLPVETLALSGLYLVRVVGYLALVPLVRRSNLSVNYWSSFIYIIGIGFAVIGLVQYGLYPDLRNIEYLGWDPHYYRVVATLLDPNYLGGLLVIVWFWGVWMWERFPARKLFLFIGQLLLSSALLLTFSRSSYLAWIVGMLMIGVIKKRIWLIGAIGLGLSGLFLILPKPGWGFVQFDRMITVVARIENWVAAVEMFKASPIIGLGFNTLRFRDFPTVDLASKAAAGVDNSFLFVLVTSGFIGLIAFGNLLKNWVKLWLGLMASKKLLTLGQTGMVMIAAISIHSLFINSLFYPWILIFLVLMTGVAMKASKEVLDRLEQ